MPLEQLAEPAVRLAHEGVALNDVQAYVAELLGELSTSTPECAELWAPGGSVLGEGDTFRSHELGEALARLGSEGAEPFYRGELAAAVCAWLGQRGGSLRPEDLAGYRAIAREPVSIGYRDRRS